MMKCVMTVKILRERPSHRKEGASEVLETTLKT